VSAIGNIRNGLFFNKMAVSSIVTAFGDKSSALLSAQLVDELGTKTTNV
jgi:hypothetical protein